MIDIVYQHDDFYVVNKPADVRFNDMVLEPSEPSHRLTGFFNLCVKHFEEQLYPVHRLDKITSGLVIVARNEVAARWFQQAFEQQLIEKCYIAISDKKPKKKQGSVIGDMSKSRDSKWKLLRSKTNPAKTGFFSKSITTEDGSGLRLFIVKPVSGKTHQIRVALKSIGSPILGDELYGGQQSDRGYLHAFALRFIYNQQEIELMCWPNNGLLFQQHRSQLETFLTQPFSLSWPNIK